MLAYKRIVSILMIVSVLLVLLFWGVYVTRPLPLEKVARRLQYGQNETSIVMLFSVFDRVHAETFTRLKTTSDFPSNVNFKDTVVNFLTKNS